MDTVAPQHKAIHDDLDRWGRWLRERPTTATCASVESQYEKGGRDATPASTAPMPSDPRLLAIDQAVRWMRLRVPQHATTLRLYYVGDPRLHVDDPRGVLEPKLICRMVGLKVQDWPRWIGHCRSMVISILRELES